MTICAFCRKSLSKFENHNSYDCINHLNAINKKLLEALKGLYKMALHYKPRPYLRPTPDVNGDDIDVDWIYTRVEIAIAVAEDEA